MLCSANDPMSTQARSLSGQAGREPSVRYQCPQTMDTETAPMASVPPTSAVSDAIAEADYFLAMAQPVAGSLSIAPAMPANRPTGSQPMKTAKV